MNTPTTNKQQLIQQLSASKTKAYKIECKLSLKGMDDEAFEVRIRVDELNRRIDRLRAETMSDWLENSDKTIVDVYLINKELKRCINYINHNVDVVENIVKLVGFIDEIVEIVDVIT
ncbi:hypothetical protein [Psychrobacter sp. ASPA161_9]|uniref:hypothetical protein n=1 Tax=Psychrobacter sp. ASPA161_9 TaxID=3160961 RepID=UPI003F7EB84D